jgi:hypothetical protein
MSFLDYLPSNPFADRRAPIPKREGTATVALSALGELPKQMVGNIKNLMDAAYSHEMGTSVRDNPQYTGLAADTALNMVGIPGLTGGVPLNALGSSAKGIKAYHGSPHDFDRFDMSKIGTGEGAQAYGHGLYFAENEKVAKEYREALSHKTVAYNGAPANWDDPATIASSWLHNLGDRAAAMKQLQGSKAPEVQEAYRMLERGDPLPNRTPATGGKMYEVNINAKPEQFLDWDKPLQQQPPIVQDLARNADLSHLQEGNRTRVMLEKFRAGEEQPHYLATGHTLHNALEDYGMKPRPELSAYLKDQGIPGIKYLDQGSRGAGSGTNNYVLFDDKIIDILRKYGIVPGAAVGSQMVEPEPAGM